MSKGSVRSKAALTEGRGGHRQGEEGGEERGCLAHTLRNTSPRVTLNIIPHAIVVSTSMPSTPLLPLQVIPLPYSLQAAIMPRHLTTSPTHNRHQSASHTSQWARSIQQSTNNTTRSLLTHSRTVGCRLPVNLCTATHHQVSHHFHKLAIIQDNSQAFCPPLDMALHLISLHCKVRIISRMVSHPMGPTLRHFKVTTILHRNALHLITPAAAVSTSQPMKRLRGRMEKRTEKKAEEAPSLQIKPLEKRTHSQRKALILGRKSFRRQSKIRLLPRLWI